MSNLSIKSKYAPKTSELSHGFRTTVGIDGVVATHFVYANQQRAMDNITESARIVYKDSIHLSNTDMLYDLEDQQDSI